MHFLSAFLAVWIGGIGNQELVIGNDIVYQIPNRLFTVAFMVWTMFCINVDTTDLMGFMLKEVEFLR